MAEEYLINAQHTEDYKMTAVLYYLEHENEETLRNVCEIFKCKFQSLYRWVEKYRDTGELKRKDRVNKKLKITLPIMNFVKEEIEKKPTLTLIDLTKMIKDKFKVELSDRSITTIFNDLGITRKRVREKYYPEKKEATQEEDLKTFYTELKKHDYKKTISIDETGFKLSMNPSYGRSKSGDRVLIKKNKYPFKKYNFLCAIMYGKIVGYTLYPETNTGVKSTDIVEFHNIYIKDKFKDHLIIMDNVAMHKAKIIKESIESNGNTLMHSFPYHPDTNGAIENFFSQLKAYVKKESPATYDDLKKCIDKVIKENIKKEHYEHYL